MNVTWIDKASGSRRAGTGIGGAVSIGKDLSGDSKQLKRCEIWEQVFESAIHPGCKERSF